MTAQRSGSWRLHVPGSALVGTATTAGDGVTVLPTSPTRRFARCADLNRYYPHGVGRSGARDRVRGSTRPVTNFTVSTTLYRANRSRDRDDDRIACERH